MLAKQKPCRLGGSIVNTKKALTGEETGPEVESLLGLRSLPQSAITLFYTNINRSLRFSIFDSTLYQHIVVVNFMCVPH